MSVFFDKSAAGRVPQGRELWPFPAAAWAMLPCFLGARCCTNFGVESATVVWQISRQMIDFHVEMDRQEYGMTLP